MSDVENLIKNLEYFSPK